MMMMEDSKIKDSPLYTFLTIVKGYEEDDAELIVSFVHSNNFLQIIYNFEGVGLKDVMNYMLQNEEYEICAKIQTSAKAYAKTTGKIIELT